MKNITNLNFGDIFISYIKTMYNNTQSSVINNGHISKLFPLERGFTQGCPQSAYLFILAFECLQKRLGQIKTLKQ